MVTTVDNKQIERKNMLIYQLQYIKLLAAIVLTSKRILNSKNRHSRIICLLHTTLIETFTNVGSLNKSTLLLLGV